MSSTQNDVSFNTPLGLKIKLNYQYFFCHIVKPDRFYRKYETLTNDKMFNALSNIDTLFLTPTALVQFFSIAAVFMHLSIQRFIVIFFVLYMFGCLWRCAAQDLLLSTVLLFLSTVYKAIHLIVYAALIVSVFICGATYLILPYLSLCIVTKLFSLLLNQIIKSITKKRYGVAFNDAELCAFAVLHIYSDSGIRLSDEIQVYLSVIQNLN